MTDFIERTGQAQYLSNAGKAKSRRKFSSLVTKNLLLRLFLPKNDSMLALPHRVVEKTLEYIKFCNIVLKRRPIV
ncbi:MAG: hypothetical protein CMM52_07945 [Rhodospirillaceae bacterium]|nr:hypothetical protein [Rhodospirillaceae bacterium]